MPYKRGDVVLVLFPDSHLRTAKRRPALVVQSDDLNTSLRQTIVAMITSNMSRADHPSRVSRRLNSAEGRQAHILTDSVVMADNLATVRESEIDRSIGSLTDLTKIDAALRTTLSL